MTKRQLKKYKILESGVMPSGFKGYLVEDRSGRVTWKSIKEKTKLVKEGRIVQSWDDGEDDVKA
jgi:hypothetical protein